MRVTKCDGYIALCEAKGIARTVSLFLLQHENIVPGDNVMVHVGYAIQKMSETEAASAWLLYDEILSVSDRTIPDA